MSSSEKIKLSYKPDLEEFIVLCELNYSLIIKLLPFLSIKKNDKLNLLNDTNEGKETRFNSQKGLFLSFKVVETAVYTTTLKLHLSGLMSSNFFSHSDKMNVYLMLRVYHDVKLLEVMDESGYKAMKAIIKDDQLNYQQVDEKRQLNRFLKECLMLSLSKNVVRKAVV